MFYENYLFRDRNFARNTRYRIKHEVCLSSDQRDKRLRSSILLEWGDAVYVIDCGPDFRQQLLTAKVNN